MPCCFFCISDYPFWSKTSQPLRTILTQFLGSTTSSSYKHWGAQSSSDCPPRLSFRSPHSIFLLIQHWNVIQTAQQAISRVWEEASLKQSLKLYPPHDPLLQTNFTLIPQWSWPEEEEILVLLLYNECRGFQRHTLFWLGHRPKRGLWDSPRVWHAISGPVGFSTGGSLE